jgi:chemotaxis protein MotB
MALRRRGVQDGGLNAWPGYVDALSTLLMVIIFVLLVFVLAQGFLSVAMTGRDRALDRLNRQMAELSDMLSLERGKSAELGLSLAQATRDVQSVTAARDLLSEQLASLRGEQDSLAADRDALKTERDRLSARLSDAASQAQSAQARTDDLFAQLAEQARRADAQSQDTAATLGQLADVRRQLTEARRQIADTAARGEGNTRDLAARNAELESARRQTAAAQARLEEMRRQMAELDRTTRADKATLEAKLSDLARLAEQARALTALRDDLERQAREAAARATTEAQGRATAMAQVADEHRLGESARAQVALLTRQVDELRAQLATVQRALEGVESTGRMKDVQISSLGSRLNAALAQRVEELQRYRSEFFGRLREVLANRPGIQVVGDRFVFQSEVLFPVGSADLTPAGVDQINKLAETLKKIAAEIPGDVNWVLRVDGHADRQRVESGRWGSNWELSAGRAITVVKRLIADGVPPSRLAATGFGDNQPLEQADTPEAYARNRRIEIRLTDR